MDRKISRWWMVQEGSTWFLWWCNWADPDYQGLNSDLLVTDFFFPCDVRSLFIALSHSVCFVQISRKYLGISQGCTQRWCGGHCQTRQMTLAQQQSWSAITSFRIKIVLPVVTTSFIYAASLLKVTLTRERTSPCLRPQFRYLGSALGTDVCQC